MAGVRRTWDKEYYAAKAKERIESGIEIESLEKSNHEKQQEIIKRHREEFKPAEKDASGPMGSERAYLNARQSKIDFDDKVGKVEIIKAGQSNTSHGPGYWCEVCQCLLKDSASYLSHINGKKHQRALGYSMRVERVGADKVKERLERLKRKVQDDTIKKSSDQPSAISEYESRLAERLLQEEMERKQKKEEKEMRKKEQEEIELETVDPDIATMMGFGGFGSSKSKG